MPTQTMGENKKKTQTIIKRKWTNWKKGKTKASKETSGNNDKKMPKKIQMKMCKSIHYLNDLKRTEKQQQINNISLKNDNWTMCRPMFVRIFTHTCHAMRCMYIYKAFKQFSIDNYSFNKSAKAVKFFVYCCLSLLLISLNILLFILCPFSLCLYHKIKIKNANLSLFTSFHIIEIELFAWWFYYENSIRRNWI